MYLYLHFQILYSSENFKSKKTKNVYKHKVVFKQHTKCNSMKKVVFKHVSKQKLQKS